MISKVDTLVIKFGDFIEFNKTPARHNIEKIEYTTGTCLGYCPIFDLIINQDGMASITSD